MEKQPKQSIFRDKSLEAIESPEALNDYLHVTSPGVWLVLAAVVVLLVGLLVWGIVGRIDTTAEMAVVSAEGQTVCYVPYASLQGVMERGSVTVDGRSYPLREGQDINVSVITEDTNALIRITGKLQPGDMIVEVPLAETLGDGVYTGKVVTESLRPIALLFR